MSHSNASFLAPPPSPPLTAASPPMQALGRRLRRYARTDSPILVQGETGTGKELVAQTIHRSSPRAPAQFVAVNCGAIPRDLVESELFGTVLGAFTGARTRRGWFELAHRGTLFLDEIGDLPLSSQVALLRTLETGVIWPVGSESAQHVDIRLVCATHRPLAEMVRRGEFREDLYHRISTLTLEVPPLRQRPEDLPLLLRAFFGDRVNDVTPRAWRRIESHSWPGNVRELRNVMTRAFIHAGSNPIQPEHLQWMEPTIARSPHADVTRPLHTVVTEYVMHAVQKNGGNVRAAARSLSISPTTVYRYLACGDTSTSA